MNVVLVSVGNFQEYILVNIRQLIQLGHTSIYVIVNADFIPYFSEFTRHVTCIDVATLPDPFGYYKRTPMSTEFRNGFNVHTSGRFFYLCAFMKQYQMDRVLHLENDVLIYYHADRLKNQIDQEHIYVPLDCYNRAIASVVYVPTANVLERVLAHYNYGDNDMANFARLVHQLPDAFQTFPIGSPDMADTPEQELVVRNWDTFQTIFDAAAIGQYLGGVDPRNIGGDTTGFINETCVIKYNVYRFEWGVSDDGMRRPFLIHGDKVYPIFNLHIHCKNLAMFI
jgi:hypothetical protein